MVMNRKDFMSSIFSSCLIWSMKAGVAVRHRCCISRPASCLAQVNGDTKASKHIQALLEFAPVGDLEPGVSSSVLHGSYMGRDNVEKEGEHLEVGVEILTWVFKSAHSICWVLLSCFVHLLLEIFRELASSMVWKLLMWTAYQPVLACFFCIVSASHISHYCSSDRLILLHISLAFFLYIKLKQTSCSRISAALKTSSLWNRQVRTIFVYWNKHLSMFFRFCTCGTWMPRVLKSPEAFFFFLEPCYYMNTIVLTARMPFIFFFDPRRVISISLLYLILSWLTAAVPFPSHLSIRWTLRLSKNHPLYCVIYQIKEMIGLVSHAISSKLSSS